MIKVFKADDPDIVAHTINTLLRNGSGACAPTSTKCSNTIYQRLNPAFLHFVPCLNK